MYCSKKYIILNAEVGERFNPVGSRPTASLMHAGSKQTL